jgi:hypothetical protein
VISESYLKFFANGKKLFLAKLDVLIFIKRINGNLAKYLALKKRGREKFVLTGLADMIEA